MYAILNITCQFRTTIYCQQLLFTTSFQPTWPSSANTKIYKTLGRFIATLIYIKRNISILHKGQKIRNDKSFWYNLKACPEYIQF
jgi:hypothetical protein